MSTSPTISAASASASKPESASTAEPPRSGTSRFEQIVANNPPILESLVAQLPSQSIFDLYHTSSFLNHFLRDSPTSWKHMSWRLHQPSPNTATAGPAAAQQRQSSNYALDKLLFNLIIPFSTRLTSLVLDNTAVSGATLFQAVMILRKDTLEHVSVRGCKNVSLKYHINPWLTMHAMALEQSPDRRPQEFQKLALRSLYTYRCRHHRRRPYLPSSLNRKESDSEPTHELVLTCHKLGIWTDTAWCTTPGARCYRRRGYVTMRAQQDPREVWVVYDRLWRSRNWLGPPPGKESKLRKRKRDGRAWEECEEAANGEPLGLGPEGKHIPVHERQTHKQYTEDIFCDNCSEQILERCEQCSVMMHCSGCRKTLCASCAFDRPYTRNMHATEDEKKRFWWAPGFAVSPCSMQDIDPAAVGAPNQTNSLPNIRFRWCCTEPVFSGGGGITLSSQHHEADRLRAAPLPQGHGFEDAEFATHDLDVGHGHSHEIGSPLARSTVSGPGGRWASLAEMFKYGVQMNMTEEVDSLPRILCDDCYSSEQWRIKCKACSVALCLKHDVKEKQRVRICGYKELGVERQELIRRLKATRLFRTLWLKRKEQQKKEAQDPTSAKSKKTDAQREAQRVMEEAQLALATNVLLEDGHFDPDDQTKLRPPHVLPLDATTSSTLPIRTAEHATITDSEPIGRPLSPGSNSTGPLSRASSPAPSAHSISATPELNKGRDNATDGYVLPSTWKGCQAFFCPAMRPAGDHRRRCTAVMRQCHECKVFVCDDCVAGLDKPCPCKGCRLGDGETDPVSGGTAAFYCPNCRHDRIVQRKCRRKLACLTKSRVTQPLKERRTRPKMSPQERIGHIANILLDVAPQPGFADEFTLDTFYDSVDQELQELQEISMSAVSVVRKVQSLRSQARPGSPAALALPNIIIEGVDNLPVAET